MAYQNTNWWPGYGQSVNQQGGQQIANDPYAMDIDPPPPPPPQPQTEYLSIRVLIFEWDKNDPVLQVDHEIDELEKTFRDEYRFSVKRVKMRGENPEGDLHLGMNAIYNARTDVGGPSLLIVFYTGHGVETYSQERTRYELIWGRDSHLKNYANWTDLVLGPYLDTHGDVLMIFDCCFAGNVRHCLGLGFEGARNVQAIVAADEQNYAWKAFPGALTRLLNERLRALKHTTFTVAQLFAGIDQTRMHSSPFHYLIKGRADDLIGWLDPGRESARDFKKYGEDVGYEEPEVKSVTDDIRYGAAGAASFQQYQQNQYGGY